MRRLTLAVTASAAAVLLATAADARPSFNAHRAGGEASARERESDSATLLGTISTLLGFTATVKATPVAGSDRPRSAASANEQCEEEKKRAEAAKAADTRRTAEAEKRQRGGDPVYLAF